MRGILSMVLAGTMLLLFGQAFAFDPRDPGVSVAEREPLEVEIVGFDSADSLCSGRLRRCAGP